MSEIVSRRDFLAASTAMLALGHAPSTFPRDGAPAIIRARAAPTVAVSSSNGLAAIAKAVELADSGADSLDAAVAIAKGCPVLHAGATIQVAETFAAM